MEERNTLKHFGILGMRWGVRRFQNPDGSLTDAGKKRYNKGESANSTSSVKVSNNARTKTVHDIPDDELRRLVNRIQLERQYSQLTTREKTEGEKFVKDVLKTSAKAVAVAYTTKTIRNVVKHVLKGR